MSNYFEPLKIGDLEFANRIWMSPLTRARATEDALPVDIMVQYYRQRATAGLIITEGTYINREACGFHRVPGIYNRKQVKLWKPVTEAVHKAGGKIFCQLWHCGRVSSRDIQENGAQPLSPSGINDDLHKIDPYGLMTNGNYTKIAASDSKAMTREEIKKTIADYAKAAKNCRAAGFDGVEVHAANGYLPNQFLTSDLNKRDDEYGGSVENRIRFVTDIVEAIASELPRHRIGVHVSPTAYYNNARVPDGAAVYSALSKALDRAKIGYLHFADMNGWFGKPDYEEIMAMLRPNFTGVIVGNGGISVEKGAEYLKSGQVQALAFGRGFLANPDLVARIKARAAISEAPYFTGWYATGKRGYTDYPTMKKK